MIEYFTLLLGFMIGTILQYQFKWWGKVLDFIQTHRPPEEIIHDVEIIPPHK